MPQVVDLVRLTPNGGAQSSRKSSTDQPKTRFDEMLSRRSAKPKSGDAESTSKSEQAERKPKIEKKQKSKKIDDTETDAPEDSEAVDKSKASKSTQETDKPEAEAEVDGEAETVDESETTDSKDKSSEDSEDTTDAAALAANQAAAAQAQPATDTATTSLEEADLADCDDDQATAAVAGIQKPVSAEAIKTDATNHESAESETSGDAGEIKLVVPKTDDSSDEQGDGAEQDHAAAAKLAAGAQSVAHEHPTDAEPVDFVQQLDTATNNQKQTAPVHATAQTNAPTAPEKQFAANNVDRIVTNVTGQIANNGGSMKIRLDPPNLGELHIDVTVARDGSLSAAFQTTNDEATRLLSHNLSALKTSLEATGVAVDRIQVKQMSSTEQSSSQNSNDREQQQQNPQDHPARQEQQRREILQRMWRKLALGDEPLDLVA